jgi:biopolymer transport protein ExbD
MKLLVHRRPTYDAGLNLTPLVDIVMVLLIFLMIVGKFTGTELYLQSNLPVRQTGSAGATPPPGGFPRDEPIEVTLDLPTADTFSARVGNFKAATPEELQTILKSMLEELTTKAGKDRQDLQLIISPTKTVKYKHLIAVYTAAQLAGFEKIGFTVSR